MGKQTYLHTDLADSFADAQSAADCFRVLRKLVAGLGYGRIHYSQGYVDQNLQVQGRVIQAEMGEDYVRSYSAEAHLMADPLVDHVLVSPRPKLWSELKSDYHQPQMTEKHRRKIDHIVGYGLQAGVTLRLRRTKFGSGWVYAGASFVQDPCADPNEHDRAFLDHRTRLETLAEHYVDRLDIGEVSRRHYQLTPREFDVLKLVAEGFQVQQIADHLKLADRTTAHHLACLRHKLDARSNAHAVAIAMRMQMI